MVPPEVVLMTIPLGIVFTFLVALVLDLIFNEQTKKHRTAMTLLLAVTVSIIVWMVYTMIGIYNASALH